MRIIRYPENPLITPADVPPSRTNFEVVGAFNAGVTTYNGEILLLLRVAERPISAHSDEVLIPMFDPESGVMYLYETTPDDPRFDFFDPRGIYNKDTGITWPTTMSHLRIARSKDGRKFTVDEHPFLYPAVDYEAFGVEDPRITYLDGRYYITYTAVSSQGVAVGLAVTDDFQHVERMGLIFPPENKDVVLFPEAIGGKFYALHRPVPPGLGAPEIWLAESDNLRYWGNHKLLMHLRPGLWDSRRIGAGAVPIHTESGWLILYHGADVQNRYCMGAALLDLENPHQVIARSRRPILSPEKPYENNGFFGGVVFSCGAMVENDTIHMYYGVSDNSIAGVDLSILDILDMLLE